MESLRSKVITTTFGHFLDYYEYSKVIWEAVLQYDSGLRPSIEVLRNTSETLKTAVEARGIKRRPYIWSELMKVQSHDDFKLWVESHTRPVSEAPMLKTMLREVGDVELLHLLETHLDAVSGVRAYLLTRTEQ